MKVLLASDWHLDASTAGLDRFDDVERGARETVAAAMRMRARGERVVYGFLGDLCDPDSQRSHRCAGLASALAFELAGAGVPSFWLAGNHDVIEDGRGTTTLSALRGASEGDANRRGAWPRVFDAPAAAVVGGLPIVALPYCARSGDYDPAAFVESARGPGLSGRRPALVVGHLMVEGIGPGSETLDMARGRDVLFPTAAVRARFGGRAIMANGHYHAGGRHDGVWIPGSLERLRFDEEHHAPGYLVVEVPDFDEAPDGDA